MRILSQKCTIKYTFGFALQLLLVVVAPVSFAYEGSREPHPGYIYDVKTERESRSVEISVVEEPNEEVKTDLQGIIFTEKLTSEFKEKYREKFGQTQAEIQLHPANRYIMTKYSGNIVYSADEAREENRLFGEYMVRKLSEFHVDKYLQSSPTMIKVYEVKDKISNVNMEVKKGYKVNLNYNLAENSFNISVINPYDIESKIVLQMDPESFLPSNIYERIFYLKYHFDKKYTLGTNYKVTDGIIALVGERRVNEALTTSVTGQTYVHEHGESIRDDRVIVGFSYSP